MTQASPDPDSPASETAITGGDPAGQVAAGLQLVSQLVAQTTVVLAVLYYFGWARSNALFGYFGIDPALVRWSVTDYALRSVNVVVRPLVIVGMLVLGLNLAHQLLSAVLRRYEASGPRLLHAVVLGCAVAGTLLVVAGLLGFFDVIVYSGRYPVVPVLLAAGITLVFYAVRLAVPPDDGGTGLGVTSGLLAVLAGALTLWTVGVYAGIEGQSGAQKILDGLSGRTSVVIYSKNDLGLSVPGVRAEHLTSGRSEYAFRYSGLRLLLYSGGRYLLLSGRWVRYRDPIVILDEDKNLRFELR